MSQISQLGALYHGDIHRRNGVFRHLLRDLALFSCFLLLIAASGCRTVDGGAPAADVARDLTLAPDATQKSQALSHFAWGLFLNIQEEPAGSEGGPPGRGRPRFDPGLLSLWADPRVGEGLTLLPLELPPSPATVAPPAEGVRPPALPAELPAYVIHYLEALRRAPDNRDVLMLLVATLQDGVDAKTLGDELLRIATAQPRAGFLCLTAAEVLEVQGRRDEAMKFLERSIPAGGWSDARLVRKLCGYYWNAKRYTEIEKLLRTALRQKELKDDFGLRLTLCLFYQESALLPENQKSAKVQKRLLRQARSVARDALAMVQERQAGDGNDHDLTPQECVVMIRLLHALEAYKEALALVRTARTIFPDVDGEFDVWEVESLLKLKRQEEATVLLAKLEKKFSEPFSTAEPPAAGSGHTDGSHPYDLHNPDVRQRVRENNTNLGRLFVEVEKPKEAVAAYERALRMAPADFRLRLILGQLYLEMGQPDRTIEIVQDVKQLLHHKYRILSYAYYRLGKTQDATRYLGLAEEAALKAEDTEFFNKSFYLYFATVCEEAGWIDRAIEKAAKALSMDPQDSVSANFLGYVLADNNRDLPRAEELIRQALAAEPQNEAYLDSMAWVCYRQKRFAEALDWMRKSLKFGGEKADPVVLDHAGDISASLDLWKDARQYWEQALSAGIKTPEKVREKLRGIPPSAQPAESPK